MERDIFDLTGKTALITGGGGLLGQQHARALLDKGADVFLGDIDEIALRAVSDSLSGNLVTVHLDVTDENSVLGVKNNINETGTAIDKLINNAAINPKVRSDGLENSSLFENYSLKEWNNEINVGLTGAFLCAKIFGSQMAENKSGVILNVASDLSVIAPNQNIYADFTTGQKRKAAKPVSYSVTKTALVGLTKYIATYWALQNVRCNALSPGGVYTDQPETFVDRLSELIPMGRMANLGEYRGAIQFLCSEASSYMTGQNVVMDGGRCVW